MTITGGLFAHVNAHQLSFVDKVMLMSKLGHNVLLVLEFTSCFQWHEVTTWVTRQVHCNLFPPVATLKLTAGSIHFNLINGGVRHCKREPPRTQRNGRGQSLRLSPSVYIAMQR